MSNKVKTDKKKSFSEDLAGHLNARIIMTSAVVVLLAMIVMIMSVYFGIRIGLKDLNRNLIFSRAAADANKDVYILPLDYNATKLSYNATSGCMNGDEKNSCLLNTYAGSDDVKYVVIRSNDQLKRIMSIVNDLSDTEQQYSVPDGFFETSSIIAVANESEETSDYSINSLYHDENYNVHLETITTPRVEGQPISTGKLILIELPNIQPKEVGFRMAE